MTNMRCIRCSELIVRNSSAQKYCLDCTVIVSREKDRIRSQRYRERNYDRFKASQRKHREGAKYKETMKNRHQKIIDAFTDLVGLKCELCGIEGSSISIFDIHFPNSDHPKKPSGKKRKNVDLYRWIFKQLPKKTWLFTCPNCHRLCHYAGKYILCDPERQITAT